MTGRQRLIFTLVLIGLGIGWGSTQSLGKMSVSSGHGFFGLIFWQLIVAVIFLGAVQIVRRRSFLLSWAGLRFAIVIALVGTIIPNTSFYISVVHLPAGIMSILISTIPLMAFPIALSFGADRFSLPRLVGLLFGFAGVSLIALPQAQLPDGANLLWIAIALIGPLFYAIEGNIVAKWGTAGLDPVQATFAASVVGVLLVLPLVLASGQWIDPTEPWGRPEWALVVMSAINALMYVGYIWLARAAGSVFATQVGYVVTVSGVVWAMLLLGERFSPLVFVSGAILLAGLMLVQPRPKITTP
jgi:drug/metabolite transporter (DMT)-like permease